MNASFHDFRRELLLNNNCLRVLPYELGRLFRLQTLGLKGRYPSRSFRHVPCKPVHKALIIVAHVSDVIFTGNPLSQDILNLYQEPDGTRKLLNYMLDNLAGDVCFELVIQIV